MKDIEKLNPELEAEGRVCIQYTDPLTGRVREEIKGKNHVYTEQLLCTNWRSMMKNMPLYLTDATSQVDVSFPFVPGNPLGYGIPENGSLGVYRGAFRAADSFLGVSSFYGVSSKFVYDFTPTQALGKVGHVGLTYQGVEGASNKISNFPIKMRSTNAYNIGSDYYNRTYTVLLASNSVYKLSVTDFLEEKVEKWTIYSGTKTVVDIAALVPVLPASYSSDTSRIGFNPESNTFLLLRRYATRENEVIRYFNVLYKFDANITQLINTITVETKGGYIRSDTFSVFGGKLFSYYTRSKIIVYDLNTGEYVQISVHGEFSNEAIDTSKAALSVYDHYLALLGSYTENENGFIFDMQAERQYACVGISAFRSNYTNYYTINSCFAKNEIAGKQAFLVGEIYNRSFYVGGAITDYRLPDDAPERPEGYGMTVIYELEVKF